jgi:hypothetical protein
VALTVTIRGIDVLPYLRLTNTQPSVDGTLNERSVCRLSLIGAFRPLPLDEVIVTVDGVRVFGGTVQTVSETDAGNWTTSTVDVDAVDFNELADRIFINEPTSPGWTLRDAVSRLATQLGNLGVTLGTMNAGPLLEPLAWANVSISQALEQLSVVTGWTHRIDHFRQLTMFELGALPAPFTLTSTNKTLNAITWTRTRERYRNQQLVMVGAPGVSEQTATLYGDGSTRLFLTGYNVVEKPQNLQETIGGTTSTQTIGVYGVDSGMPYYWRDSDKGLIQDVSRPVLAATDYLAVVVRAEFPQLVAETNQPEVDVRGLVQDLVALPEEFNARTGQKYAEGLLRRYGAMPQTVAATTHRPGLATGQTVTIQVPERGLDAPYLITTLRMSHDGKFANGVDYWRFELDGVDGNEFRGSWLDYFKPLQETGKATTATVGAGGGTGGGGGGGGGTVVTGTPPIYLGGTRNASVYGSASWVPIPGFVDVLLPSNATVTVRCQSWVRDPATSIVVRLVALVSGGVEVGRGTVTSATDPLAAAAFQQFTATLQSSWQYYRLEALLSSSIAEGFVASCFGYL